MVEQPEDPADPEVAAVSGDIEIPLGIVISRILIVSCMSVAAALGIFFLIGGIWLWGAVGMAVTVVFLVLMFAIERLVE